MSQDLNELAPDAAANQPAEMQGAERPADMYVGDLKVDKVFREIAERLSAEDAETHYQTDTPETAATGELGEPAPQDVGDQDAEADREAFGRHRFGRVAQAAPSLYRAPLSSEGSQAAEKLIQVEGWASKPFALREQLSQDTLLGEPDHHSLYNIAPQSDGGRGVHAMASAYVSRERARQQTTDAQPEKSVIWAYSYTGLDLRDFLASVVERDNGKAVLERTRAVLACDSEKRKKAIEDSRLFEGYDVTVEVIDPQDPETLAIPANTAVALMSDSLDKLPAHQVLIGADSKHPLEIMEETLVTESRPLVSMNGRSGQAHAIPVDTLEKHETASGPDRFGLIPQLSGRLRDCPVTTFELEHTDLATQEHSTAAFLASMPEHLRNKHLAFNYAEDVETVVRAVTAAVRNDGLIYISGPMRNATELRPESLTSAEGPVVSHMLEERSLRSSVDAGLRDITRRQGREQTAAEASMLAVRRGREGTSYLVIDRAGQNEGQTLLLQSFRAEMKKPAETSPLGLAVANYDTAWSELADSQEQNMPHERRASKTLATADAYLDLIEVYPQAGRDPAAALAISRELRATDQNEQALAMAEMASRAAPSMSAPLVEIARSRLALGQDPRLAFVALKRAHIMTPHNPEVYAALLETWDKHPDIKDTYLPAYATAAGNYLRYAANLTNNEIIDKLESISKALKRDWELHKDDMSTYKTVIVQDIETGIASEHALSVRDMKRIIAADVALANAEVVGALRRYESADKQPVLDDQQRLFAIWQSTVPRDEDGLPKPRDLWEDKPPLRGERWVYNGSIYDSDEEVAPPSAKQLRSYAPALAVYEAEQPSVVADGEDSPDDEDYPVESGMDLHIGEAVDNNGDDSDSGAFAIPKDVLPGHVLITGRTGTGKTKLLEKMLEGVPRMDANFWAFDLGDKSELGGVADKLKAKGVPVTVITPGDLDSIPVSIDFLRPVEGCTIDEHIGMVVDAWITAYGGGGDSPVGQILSGALRDIYAANGWPVKPLEGEDPPEIAEGEPRTPTLPELLDACVKRSADYGKNTEAGNIPVYFKKRIEALQAGAFGDFLVGENVLDWELLNKTNVVFDFSHITSHDQRRFLFTALTMQASSYLKQQGLKKVVNTVWAIDEASLITASAGEGEMSRKQGVEAYTARLKVLRGYGVSIWNATQTIEGMDPAFISQNAVTIALSLKPVEEKKKLLNSLGVEEGTPLYKELFAILTKATPGEAVAWRTGMAKPRVVKVDLPKKPTRRNLAEAKRTRIRPPIKPNPYDSFTARQHEEAILASRRAKQAWKQLFVGAVTMAHVAHIEMPKVPDKLHKQWTREITGRDGKIDETKREMARLILYYLVKQTVSERITSVRTAYAPKELTSSVMAFALGALNGEPTGSYASPAFGLLPVRELRTFRDLTDPRYGLKPHPEQMTTPLPYTLPTPTPTISRKAHRSRPPRKRVVSQVGSQVSTLEHHRLSPVYRASEDDATANAEAAFVGAVGKLSGRRYWRAMREVTGGEPDPGVQRRMVAAELGYVASSYTPRESELASVLTLPTYLYRHGARPAETAKKVA